LYTKYTTNVHHSPLYAGLEEICNNQIKINLYPVKYGCYWASAQ